MTMRWRSGSVSTPMISASCQCLISGGSAARSPRSSAFSRSSASSRMTCSCSCCSCARSRSLSERSCGSGLEALCEPMPGEARRADRHLHRIDDRLQSVAQTLRQMAVRVEYMSMIETSGAAGEAQTGRRPAAVERPLHAAEHGHGASCARPRQRRRCAECERR